MRRLTAVSSVFSALIWCLTSHASIIVGGSEFLPDPGWPQGGLELANVNTRFRWFEGPPFGGGEWTLEYRGSTDDLNAAIALFGKIRAPGLEITLVDGTGGPYGLPNDDASSYLDWSVTLWNPRNFHFLYNNARSKTSMDSRLQKRVFPPSTMTVFLGDRSRIAWGKIHVPSTVKVVDKRLSSNGYSRDAGSVIVGSVYECSTGLPVSGARVTLRKYVNSGSDTEVVHSEITVDESGAFEMRGIKSSGFLEVKADGYVARKIIPFRTPGSRFENVTLYLAKPAVLEGVIVDSSGTPMADKFVFAGEYLGLDGVPYESFGEPNRKAVTDASGRYRIENVPEGFAAVRCEGACDWFPTKNADGRQLGWAVDPDNRLVFVERRNDNQ